METNQNVKVKGEITAKFYDQSALSLIDRIRNKVINLIVKKGWRDRKFLMDYYHLGRLKETQMHTNIICNAGFEAICKRLAGTLTYTGEITKMALGTGTAVAAVTDIKLVTETYRNTTASGVGASNVAYLTAYYTEAECNGTYTEFGNFIDGAAGADTGQLWSRITGITWVKDAVTVLVVDCKYTFASI